MVDTRRGSFDNPRITSDVDGASPLPDFDKTCFLVTPIGKATSIERAVTELLGERIIDPALEGFGFEVIRADTNYMSGDAFDAMIKAIKSADLVIADTRDFNRIACLKSELLWHGKCPRSS